MASWRKFRDTMLAGNPSLKAEYDRLGPRYAAISALIRARNSAKVSQSELARRMKVRQNTVSRLESGEHSPRIDTLAAAAEALGYDLRVTFVKPRAESRTASRRRTASGRA